MTDIPTNQIHMRPPCRAALGHIWPCLITYMSKVLTDVWPNMITIGHDWSHPEWNHYSRSPAMDFNCHFNSLYTRTITFREFLYVRQKQPSKFTLKCMELSSSQNNVTWCSVPPPDALHDNPLPIMGWHTWPSPRGLTICGWNVPFSYRYCTIENLILLWNLNASQIKCWPVNYYDHPHKQGFDWYLSVWLWQWGADDYCTLS